MSSKRKFGWKTNESELWWGEGEISGGTRRDDSSLREAEIVGSARLHAHRQLGTPPDIKWTFVAGVAPAPWWERLFFSGPGRV